MFLCAKVVGGRQSVTRLCANVWGEASFIHLFAKVLGEAMCHTFVCESLGGGDVSHFCVRMFWQRYGVTHLCANVLGGGARYHMFVCKRVGGGKVSRFGV